MIARRDRVRILIKLAPTVEDADEAIVENYGFQSIQEKIAFLKGMFDVECIEYEVKPDEMTYFSMLKAIIEDL